MKRSFVQAMSRWRASSVVRRLDSSSSSADSSSSRLKALRTSRHLLMARFPSIVALDQLASPGPHSTLGTVRRARARPALVRTSSLSFVAFQGPNGHLMRVTARSIAPALPPARIWLMHQRAAWRSARDHGWASHDLHPSASDLHPVIFIQRSRLEEQRLSTWRRGNVTITLNAKSRPTRGRDLVGRRMRACARGIMPFSRDFFPVATILPGSTATLPQAKQQRRAEPPQKCTAQSYSTTGRAPAVSVQTSRRLHRLPDITSQDCTADTGATEKKKERASALCLPTRRSAGDSEAPA